MTLKERLIKLLANSSGLTYSVIAECILREIDYRPENGYYWDNTKQQPCKLDEHGLHYFHDTEVYPYTTETSLRKL